MKTQSNEVCWVGKVGEGGTGVGREVTSYIVMVVEEADLSYIW